MAAFVAAGSLLLGGLALRSTLRRRLLTNWSGNQTFKPTSLHQPTSLPELQALVAAARAVKVLGSAHSFSALACPARGGALVSLARLDLGAPSVDERTGVCWVPGHYTYAALVAHLERAAPAWSLHNMASLPHITVAGSIATGTHGSGVACGNLASCVVGLELVLADGSALRASPASHPQEWPGLVVHLGALGVVTRVALQLVPAFWVRQVCYEGLSLEAVAAAFDEIMCAGYSVSLFTTWRGPVFEQCWRKCVCAAPGGSGGGGGEEEGLEGLFPPAWHGATRALHNLHPIPGVSAQPCTPQLGERGPAHHRLPHFRAEFTPSAGEELQSEFFVARSDAPAALRALSALREHIAPLLHICEVRTIAADSMWLSMASGRDSVALHFTWLKQWGGASGVAALLPRLEAALAPFAPRPHWGKLSSPAGWAAAGARYGEGLRSFAALRARLDPQGKFMNDALQALLTGSAGGASAEGVQV